MLTIREAIEQDMSYIEQSRGKEEALTYLKIVVFHGLESGIIERVQIDHEEFFETYYDEIQEICTEYLSSAKTHPLSHNTANIDLKDYLSRFCYKYVAENVYEDLKALG